MTYEEARDHITHALEEVNQVIANADVARVPGEAYAMKPALELAIDAIQKQIPKGPLVFNKKEKRYPPVYICANCNRSEYIRQIDALDTYCGFCGQAQDWRE